MSITIEAYRPEWAPYFDKFNKAWLEEYFVVEPIDKWVLENPDEAILKEGGRILFALKNGIVIGTVALKFVENGVYELTKMAVDKPYRGIGAGKLLCQAAIDLAASLHAHKVILYSQTTLVNAIDIYRKLGFIEIPLEKGKYARADIKMELLLTSHK